MSSLPNFLLSEFQAKFPQFSEPSLPTSLLFDLQVECLRLLKFQISSFSNVLINARRVGFAKEFLGGYSAKGRAIFVRVTAFEEYEKLHGWI